MDFYQHRVRVSDWLVLARVGCLVISKQPRPSHTFHDGTKIHAYCGRSVISIAPSLP